MTLLTNQADDYLFGEYRGRHFGLLRHHGNWRVFLDQRLLEGIVTLTRLPRKNVRRSRLSRRLRHGIPPVHCFSSELAQCSS